MKKSLYVLFIMAFILYPLLSSHAYEYEDQNRKGILAAMKEKPDLEGEDKSSILRRFGPPIYKDTSDTPEGKKDIWRYRPYKRGYLEMTVTFIEGKVTEVDYGDE